ncbi:hypothetical protein BASA81_007950 [Batrachochytrium salamandrivorans]|nr:hypothetical protein BASA81_007950 [Batrachochytrium salamandrivorans]
MLLLRRLSSSLPAHIPVVIPPSSVDAYRLKRWDCVEGDLIAPERHLCLLATSVRDHFLLPSGIPKDIFLAKRLVRGRTSNLRKGNVIALLVESKELIQSFAACTFAEFNPQYEPVRVHVSDSIRLPRVVGENVLKMCRRISSPTRQPPPPPTLLNDYDNPLEAHVECNQLIRHASQLLHSTRLDTKLVRELLFYLFVWEDVGKAHRDQLFSGEALMNEISSRRLTSFTDADLVQTLELFPRSHPFVDQVLQELDTHRDLEKLSKKHLALVAHMRHRSKP